MLTILADFGKILFVLFIGLFFTKYISEGKKMLFQICIVIDVVLLIGELIFDLINSHII